MAVFRIKRVYEAPDSADGIRVLVDRLWPRGLTKDDAAVQHWMKELAPSKGLREWFGHDPAKWSEFRARYCAELSTKKDAMDWLRGLTSTGPVTIVYGARDTEHNNAVALAEYLTSQRASG